MECALFDLVTLCLLRCSIHKNATRKKGGQSYSPRTNNLTRAWQLLWLPSQAHFRSRLTRNLLSYHGRIPTIQ